MSNKSTSITIRLNNGEIKESIEALRAFCLAVLVGQDVTPKTNPIADAMLKTYTTKETAKK
jgi:hypothetical protein